MARTKSPAKEQTSKANFDAYRERTGGFGFKKFGGQNQPGVKVNMKEMIGGVGCCVSLSKTCHVFIMSTDSENLKEALRELGIKKSERSAEDVSLIAVYPADIEEIIKHSEENDRKIFWVINRHDESNAEMMYGYSLRYRPDLKVLGEAERCTKLECKLLLRGLKWDREDIDRLFIDDDHPDDKIPF